MYKFKLVLAVEVGYNSSLLLLFSEIFQMHKGHVLLCFDGRECAGVEDVENQDRWARCRTEISVEADR
jgi:hypothetical protein